MRRHLSLLLCTLLLSACSADGPGDGPPPPGDPGDSEPEVRSEAGTLRIDSPLPGAILANTLVRVSGSVDVPGATEVMVNGAPAPIADGRYEIDVELPEGPARIEASVADLTALVEVWVDASGPVITIESPEPGSFIEGERLRVTGRVDDPSLTGLTANGEAVGVDRDGRFSYEQVVSPGAHRIRLRAEDSAGHVTVAYTSALVGHFAPLGDSISGAMTLGAGLSAFGELSDGATDMVRTMDVESLVLMRNPAVSAWWGEINVTSLDHGPVTVDIQPRDGQLTAFVTVEDIDVTIAGRITGTLHATGARMQASVAISAWDGSITASLRDPYVMLDGFTMALDWVPSFLEDLAIIRDNVRERIEAAIIDAVDETVPGYLESALSAVPTGGSFNVMGIPMEVAASVRTVDVTRYGLRAVVDAGIRGGVTDLGHGAAAPGSLRLPMGEAPAAGGDGVSVGIALDVINQAIFAAWSTGALSYRFDDPPFGDGTLKVAQLALLAPGLRSVAPPEAPVSFVVSATLPPVAVPGAPGRVEVQVADIRVDAIARVDGADVPLATLSLGASADAGLRVEDDLLSVDIGEITLTADVISSAARMPVGEDLDSLLETAMGDRLDGLLDIGGLRVPSFYGFAVDAPMARVDGGYLLFSGNLTYMP